MPKYIFNNTENEIVYHGKAFPALDYRDIPTTLESIFANNSQLFIDISLNNVIISKTEDSSGHILDVNTAINYLKDNLPKQVESVTHAFGNKILPDGKKLFRRVQGITASVQNAPDNVDFTIPYNNCKITGVQILNAKLGDKANFKVLDSSTGTYTGTPYLLLNQFGFNVNIIPDVASYPSKYDADLLIGMILRLEYDAVDELLPRTIYINFDLHEVKD